MSTGTFTDANGQFFLKWDFLLSGYAGGDSIPVHLTLAAIGGPGSFDSLDIKLPFTTRGNIPPQDTLKWVTSRAP